MGTSLGVLEQQQAAAANYLSDSDSRSLQEVPSSQQGSARIAWSPTGRFRSRVLPGGSWHPTPVQHEYVSETISFVILEWSCCSVDLEYSRSCKTAGPALGVERKSQQQQQVCEKAQLTFIVAMYSWCERLKNLFILDSCLWSKRSNVKAWKVMQLFGPTCRFLLSNTGR